MYLHLPRPSNASISFQLALSPRPRQDTKTKDTLSAYHHYRIVDTTLYDTDQQGSNSSSRCAWI